MALHEVTILPVNDAPAWAAEVRQIALEAFGPRPYPPASAIARRAAGPARGPAGAGVRGR